MKRIHDILWYGWDPFGVKDFGPEDEYDSYIGGIYRLLVSGTNREYLANHLRGIQTDSMGMSIVSEGKLDAVVDKLLELDVSLGVK